MRLNNKIKAAKSQLDKMVKDGASVSAAAQTLMGRHREAMEQLEADWEQCYPSKSNLPQSLLLKLFTYAMVRRTKRIANCDHNYIDIGDASPNSGNMDCECCKCGHYISAPLY